MWVRRGRNKLGNQSYGKICIVILLVYAFMCGSDLGYAINRNMSILEYVLYTLTDHYYMIYGWLFFLVFFSVRQVKEKSCIERIRYGTWKRFYTEQCITNVILLAGMIWVHAVIPFVIGWMKLPFRNEFVASASQGIQDSNMGVVLAYGERVKTPLGAIVCVLLYWTLGSVFISQLIYHCNEIWSKKGMIASIILVLVSTMIGFMTDIEERFSFFPFGNTCYILHHVWINIGTIPMGMNIGMMVFGIWGLEKLAVLKNSNPSKKRNGITQLLFTASPIVYWLFFSILIFLGIIGMTGGETDAYAVIFGLVKGFSDRSFQFMEFLYYITPVMFILFFINAAWEKEATCHHELALFRFGNQKKWHQMVEKSCLKFLFQSGIVYIGSIVVVSLICLILLGGQNSGWLGEIATYYEITNEEVLISFVLALGVRILEISFLYSVDRCIYMMTNHAIVSYLAVFALYIPGILFPKIELWIPGKGSAYQMLEVLAVHHENQIPIMILVYTGWIFILNRVSQSKKLIARKEMLCQRSLS